MLIVLAGMFRNSTRYLDTYFAQVSSLSELLKSRGDRLRLIFAEGDSADDTWDQLIKRTSRFETILVKREHRGPYWGSVDVEARWQALSWVCNGILDKVDTDVDKLVYVETDLLWNAETLCAVLDQLTPERPVISPMCFTEAGHFYDTWGHIKNGKCFIPFPPYHDELPEAGLTQVESAGSALAMLGEVARTARYGPDLVRGLGRSIYEHGFSWWVDPTLRVVHPC